MMLDPNIKAEWVERLRSGQYTQCQGHLKKGGGHCCLGVLSDMHSGFSGNSWREFDRDDQGVKASTYLDSFSALGSEVAEWATEGRTGDPDKIQVVVEGKLCTLDHLNDSGYTFLQIANLIDQQL